MDAFPRIPPPHSSDDNEGALRVFNDFFHIYQPVFARVEFYLEQVITQVDPMYAQAYRPWHKSLRDLMRGVYLMARRVPLPDPDAFLDALRTFSFDSAIYFLRDICVSCKLHIERGWAQRFRENILTLLFALGILQRQHEQQLQR